MGRKKIELILFDLDDTLVDTSRTLINRIKELKKKYPIKEKDVSYICNILAEQGRDKILERKYNFSKYFFIDYELLRTKILVNPIGSIKNLFESIKRKDIMVGVLTNNIYQKSKLKLQRCGIEEESLNGGFYYYEILPFKKPDKRCFNILQADIREKSIYVGDSVNDYKAAKNSGIKFIAVTTGLTKEKDFLNAGLEKSKILKDVHGILNFLK